MKPELSESKLSFLLGTYQAVVERLRPRIEGEENEEFDQFEELEEYKIVFEMSNFDNGGTPVEVSELEAKENRLSSNEAQITNDTTNQDSDLGVSEVVSDNLSENSVGIITMSETSLQLLSEENKLQVLLHQKQKKLEEFEIQKGEKEVKPLSKVSKVAFFFFFPLLSMLVILSLHFHIFCLLYSRRSYFQFHTLSLQFVQPNREQPIFFPLSPSTCF